MFEEFDGEINIVYRHFPLTNIHDKAVLAAEASEAAGAQGAFWEYHDLLFEKQSEWSRLDVDEAQNTFVEYAKELGLDEGQFQSALDEGIYRDQIETAEQEARAANLSGTPTIAINGYVFPLQQVPLNRQGIEFFVGLTQLAERQLALPEPVIDLDKSYQATIVTEKGEVVIELFPDTAPTNVNSFVYLAQNGWYDDVTFHRVLDGFMAQAGDPSGSGMGWPGYRCGDEIAANRTFDQAGVVAMANSGPNTNGGQFFITYGPTPHLNAGFTIIGQVISGQEVADSLTRRDPQTNPTFTGDKIVTITVAEQ